MPDQHAQLTTLDSSWKILAVEDNDLDVELMSFYLNKIDSRLGLLRATNGEEALTTLSESLDSFKTGQKFLIFLDLNMPRMNGFELLEHLGSKPWFDRLHIVILSTSDHSMDKHRTLELGASSYLAKPISEAMLNQTLTSLCNKPVPPRA